MIETAYQVTDKTSRVRALKIRIRILYIKQMLIRHSLFILYTNVLL